MNSKATSFSCERVKNMRSCINAFIESVQDKPGTCRTLSKSFPQCHAECPEAVLLISNQLWKNFSENMHSHAETLIQELGLEELLQSIENNSSLWKFTGRPRDDVVPFIAQSQSHEVALLQDLLEKSRSEVEEAKAELAKEATEVAGLFRGVEEKLRILEQIGEKTATQLTSVCSDIL